MWRVLKHCGCSGLFTNSAATGRILKRRWDELIRNFPTVAILKCLYDGPDVRLVLGTVKSATEITRLESDINVNIVVTFGCG